MFAIFGSGFGLYGYLPALIQAGENKIILPERYKVQFKNRTELSCFGNNIKWKQDDNRVLNSVDSVVLALRPLDHVEWINRCLAIDDLRILLLEKPLTENPDNALKIFDNLIKSKKIFRIGFIFRFTKWGNAIFERIKKFNTTSQLIINWSFMAHHFQHDLHNWKRFHDVGGGVIRFYGIHLIALLAELGYREVLWSRVDGKSENEIEKWSAVFSGNKLPECIVTIDSRSLENKFNVKLDQYIIAESKDPFEVSDSEGLINTDRRISLISDLYKSLSNESEKTYEWYFAMINLWRCTEQCTKYKSHPVDHSSINGVIK